MSRALLWGMRTALERLRLFLLSVMLVASPAAVFATHPVGSEDYSLVGIAVDGAYAYFERLDEDPEGNQELWLRVVDVTTGKVAKAVAILRECDVDPDMYADDKCETGTRISKKQSAKYRAQIYAKYGEPVGGRKGKLVAAGDPTMASALLPTASGFAQTWQIGKVRITTRLKSASKLLPAYEWQSVAVTMEVLLEGPWGKCEGRGKFSVSPEAKGWSNEISWPSLSAESLQLAPKGKAIALVLGNRPVVIALKPIAGSTASPVPDTTGGK